MRTLMVTGVCGAGKSTITQELSRRLKIACGDYADLMLEVMQDTDKDKIQFLDWEMRRDVYNQVERLITTRFSRENSDGRIHLLENHLTIIQDSAVVSFPIRDYEKYNLVGLIVVEAPPQSVLERRLKDQTRKRMTDTLELIDKQQRVNSEEAEKIAKYLGIPLFNITNNDGMLPILEVEKWVRRTIYQESQFRHAERL